MNFNELSTVVFNDDTWISFLQNKNKVKVSEICENDHLMSIKVIAMACQKRSCRKGKKV